MNLLTSLKWDCIQPSDGSGSRSVRVNDEFPDESEVIASSRSGINVFDLFGEILDGADLRQFLKDHHVDATQYKEPGALILRAFLLLVDVNRSKHEEQQVALTGATIEEEDEDQFEAIEIKEEPLFLVEIESEENSSNSAKPTKRKRKRSKDPSQNEWTCRVGVCRDLELKFDSREAYMQHKKDSTHFPCKACNMAFHTTIELKHHYDQASCRAFTCPHCDANFQTDDPKKKASRTTKLRTHINSCTNNRPFVCDACGLGFYTKCKLKKHWNTHSVQAEQKRLLQRLNNRAMSEAKRVNPRAFPCDQCDMAYTTNQRLKFHKMAVHEGIKFPCPHCDTKLANPSTLARHIQSFHDDVQVAHGESTVQQLAIAD